MIQINVHEAKTKLSSLLIKVERKGEWIRICRNGKPVADLRPIPAVKKPLKLNPKLCVKFKENPMLPLEKENWPGQDEDS